MYNGEDIKRQKEARANNIAKSFSNSNELLEKAHSQGDVHPNGKWYWETSAAGGRGDWRTIGGRGSKKTSSPVINDSPDKDKKTWRDFISYKDLKEIPSYLRDMSYSELKKQKKKAEEIRDNQMIDMNRRGKAKEEVWKINTLLSAHEKVSIM